jgi:hypothetical protein|tara:strand:+ start:471 stop:809 length:339 start_codon:yes stop_codon:yes gene_type:complete
MINRTIHIGMSTEYSGFNKDTAAMLSKRLCKVFREKANKTPTNILRPRLSSLTLPKTKETAKRINKIVVTGWNIFRQYSRSNLFFLNSDPSSVKALSSSLIDKYFGERTLLI